MIQFSVDRNDYRREADSVRLDLWDLRHITINDDSWTIPRHMVGHYTLVYMKKGTLAFTVGGAAGTLKDYQLLCVASAMLFSARPAAAGACDFDMLEFDCSDFAFFTLEDGFRVMEAPNEINEQFYQFETSDYPEGFRACADESRLLLLLNVLGRYSRCHPQKQTLLDEVRRYINTHIFDEITVQSLADALRYHKDYLGRVVKQYGHTTIKKMIVDERIKVAKSLLASTDYPISGIADLLRFNSVNHFYKYFKYHTNVSPAVYRASHMA